MKEAVLILILFSCGLCHAQIDLPNPFGLLKHIPLTDSVLNSLPDFVGPPEDLVELPVGKSHLWVAGAGKRLESLRLYFYIKKGNGTFLKIFEKEYKLGVIPKDVDPHRNWISALKLSKDRTIQLVVTFPKSRWTRGEFFFSYDPVEMKIYDLGSPNLYVVFQDLAGDGTYEILAGSSVNNWDDSGVDYQEILNVQKDKFIDTHAKYPAYFRKLVRKYEQDCQKIEDERQKPHPDSWDESFFNNETEIDGCILQAYINGGFKMEAKKFGLVLCQRLEDKMKSEKEEKQNTYFTGLDLQHIQNVLKGAKLVPE
jgi:hypothetical protein